MMTREHPRLQLDAVVSGYGLTEVLHGVDLFVAPGEVVAVLGPNGAGKTTLVNTVSGLVKLRRGGIFSDGVRLSALSSNKVVGRGVVQVPEGRRIFTELTVEENLVVGGYLIKDREAVDAAREQTFALFPVLAERRRQSAGTLSGGEQQMLAMGRALSARPRLLMLDEPSMGLAPKVVTDIYNSFPAIVASGASILLIEQNAKKALQAASRAYVLDQGRVVMSRSSAELEGSDELQQLYLGGHAAKEVRDSGK